MDKLYHAAVSELRKTAVHLAYAESRPQPNPDASQDEAGCRLIRRDAQDAVVSLRSNPELIKWCELALTSWLGGSSVISNGPSSWMALWQGLKREFGHEDEFLSTYADHFAASVIRDPHVSVTWLAESLKQKKANRIGAKFWLSGSDQLASVEADCRSDPMILFLNHRVQDSAGCVLRAELYKSQGSSIIGSLSLPLDQLDLAKDHHDLQVPVMSVKQPQNMIGTCQLSIEFHNLDQPFMKRRINELFVEHIFRPFFFAVFQTPFPDLDDDERAASYFIRITAPSSLDEGLKPKLMMNDMDLEEADQDLLLPVQNWATDQITLELLLNSASTPPASSPGPSAKAMSPFRRKNQAVEAGEQRRRRKSSLEETLQMAKNTLFSSPNVRFRDQLDVTDISWSKAAILSMADLKWTFELVAGHPLEQPEDKKRLCDLFVLAIISELQSLFTSGDLNAVMKWDGHFSNPLFSRTFALLRPVVTARVWTECKAEAMFRLHQDYCESGLINASLLSDQLQWLDNAQLANDYRIYCLRQLAEFEAPPEAQLNRLEAVLCHIKSLNSLYSVSGQKLETDLTLAMEPFVRRRLLISADQDRLRRLSVLENRLDQYAFRTLDTVDNCFGNFGLSVWCPTLARVIVLDVCLPAIQRILQELDTRGPDLEGPQAELTTTDLDTYTSLFTLFGQIKTLGSRYLGRCDRIFEVFDSCLPYWALCAAAKAQAQVERVIAMEKEKHLQQQTSGFGSTWVLPAGQVHDWLEGAINVDGIFRSCQVTWQRLSWPNAARSITQFGLNLFDRLHNIFKFYVRNLIDIIMMDDLFDRHELVLALNSYFHSIKYLDNFSLMLSQEMQKLADDQSEQDLDYNGGELQRTKSTAARISLYEEKLSALVLAMDRFGIAKNEVEAEADKLVAAFGEGQRAVFRSYLQSGRLRDHTEDSLLNYLNELLKFFHQNINLGDEEAAVSGSNMTLKYNRSIRENLFQILEEELLRFSNEAESLYQKKPDPKVFGELDKAVQDTIIFRRNLSMKHSDKLDTIVNKISIKSSPSSSLITAYLAAECRLKSAPQSKTVDLGVVRFCAGFWAPQNEVLVRLKSVNHLKPRDGREDCNFSLKVSVLPVAGEMQVALQKKSLVFPLSNFHLFDVSDQEPREEASDLKLHGSSNAERYNFSFKLPPGQSTSSTFVEISLFDHSRTKLYKVFRASCIMPVSSLCSIDEPEDLELQEACRLEQQLQRLSDPDELNALPEWVELIRRKDSDALAKNFVHRQQGREKASLLLPKSHDWADGSFLPITAGNAAAQCLFPGHVGQRLGLH